LGDGRQRLLRTAFRLFGERGFDSVSVREIAAASSVSIGLIKHHFGSKEGCGRRSTTPSWRSSRRR